MALVVAHLGDVLGTENRDYIRLATSGGVYLALLFSLQLIEQLLKQGVGHTIPAGAADTSAGAEEAML